jgi:hypothetical protein
MSISAGYLLGLELGAKPPRSIDRRRCSALNDPPFFALLSYDAESVSSNSGAEQL